MNRLIVISPEGNVDDETEIVNAMFDEGLQNFHLRKTWSGIAPYRKYLEGIKKQYLPRIAVHLQFHGALKLNELKRIHLKEKQRIKEEEMTYRQYIEKGFKLSTSIHDPESLKILQPYWEYVFLSPVAESISKPGYKNEKLSRINIKKENGTPPVIALGGITTENAESILDKGYDGIAVLGTIWQDPKNAVNKFKSLKAICGN